MKSRLLPLLSLAALAAAAPAQQSSHHLVDPIDDLGIPSYRSGFYFNGTADLDRGGDFNYQQILLSAPLTKLIPLGDDVHFFATLDYEASFLDFDVPAGVPLEDFDVHMLRTPLSVLGHREGSPWTWLLRLDPGVATDFSDFDSHDFRIGGRAGVSYEFSETLSLSAGIGLTEAYGDYIVLPLVGFDWVPAEDWLVSLSGPRLSVSHQPSENWVLRSAVYLSGGSWNVETGGASRELTLRSLHAGVGAERRLTDKLWLTAWTGFSFANKIDLSTTSSRTIYESHADSAWFGFLGVRMAAW